MFYKLRAHIKLETQFLTKTRIISHSE